MTSAETLELAVIVGISGVVYWRWLRLHDDRKQQLAWQSGTYAVTRSGSWLIPQFDPYVRPGTEIFIPAGDGLYITRVSRRRAKLYRAGLRDWVGKRRATVHMIVTAPNSKARQEWQALKDEHPDFFHVYFLHRERITGPSSEEKKSQIAKIDTFHPVFLADRGAAGANRCALWLESYHPPKSKFAYNVEFVAPEAAATDSRTTELRQMYDAILHGAHVDRLEPSDRGLRTRIAA